MSDLNTWPEGIRPKLKEILTNPEGLACFVDREAGGNELYRISLARGLHEGGLHVAITTRPLYKTPHEAIACIEKLLQTTLPDGEKKLGGETIDEIILDLHKRHPTVGCGLLYKVFIQEASPASVAVG